MNIKRIAAVLMSVAFFSTSVFCQDGTRVIESNLNSPYGMALDKDKNLIIVDSYNNLIKKVKGGELETIAGSGETGYKDVELLKSQFNAPRRAAVDSKGNIFITDTKNNVIRRIPKGKDIVYTFAGTGEAGYKNGRNDKSMFNRPMGIAIDESDNIYVADMLNHVIRKIDKNGKASTFAGKQSGEGSYKDGSLKTAMFNEPSDIEIDIKGNMYILDSGNQLVRKIEGGKVTTFSGNIDGLMPGTKYASGGYMDGPKEWARYNFPKGMDIADDGTIFIADTWNNKVRAIRPDGNVITVAGGGFSGPVDVMYDSGKLYVCEMWENDIKIMPIVLETIPAEEEKGMQIWINGEKLYIPDGNAFIMDGRTMVPLRFICEKLGANVEWLGSTSEVEVKKDGLSQKFSIDGNAVVLKEGRTYVQIRRLSESMGFEVEWIPEKRKIDIRG